MAEQVLSYKIIEIAFAQQ